VSHKVCNICETSKPIKEFYQRKERGGEPRSSCKVCWNIRATKWNIANEDKIKKRRAVVSIEKKRLTDIERLELEVDLLEREAQLMERREKAIATIGKTPS